jgi:hypothetical protein
MTELGLHPIRRPTALISVSRGLSQVAVIGLQALDNLQIHRRPDAATLQKNLQLLDKVAPSVQ